MCRYLCRRKCLFLLRENLIQFVCVCVSVCCAVGVCVRVRVRVCCPVRTGETLLHVAIAKKQPKLIQYLLDNGANVYAQVRHI